MKIKKLHIYGYGKFQDKTIDFHSPMHFIQGENEAGKSTIRAFIQAVLFGFPSKRENALRYEPKTGTHYGGSLTIELENKKIATIERLARKKAAGEVTVYTEEGESFGEDWLSAMLGNMDRGIFQGIFCFGLEGLSEIQHLKGDELNKYIYEAGMTGTRHIAQMEKNIEEELAGLFKPKGQKPIINKNIKNLHDKRLRLREWENQFETYDNLMEEKQDLVGQQKEWSNKKKKLNRQKEHLHRKQTFVHFLNEKNAIEKQLQTFRPFQDVQLEKEEEWIAQKQKYEEAKKQLEEAYFTMEQLASKNKGAALKWSVLYHKDKFFLLKEKVSVYRKYVEDYNRIIFTIDQKQAELTEKQERVGEIDAASLRSSVTTIYAEEELQQIVEKGKELKERLRLLKEQHQQQKEKMELNQTDIDRMKETRRTTEERENSETIVMDQKSMPTTLHSWKQPIVMLQSAAIVFFTLGIWEMITGHWLMGIIMFGAGVAGGFLWYLQKQQKNIKGTTANENSFYWKHKSLLEEDQRLDAAIRECEWQLARENNRYQLLEDSLKEESEKWNTLQTELDNWRDVYNFPSVPSVQSAASFFQNVKEWKGLDYEIKNLQKQEKDISETLEDIKVETTRLADRTEVSYHGVEETIAVLQDVFEKEEQRKVNYDQEAKTWIAAVQDVQYYESACTRPKETIQQLYRSTGVDSHATFIHAIKQKKKYQEWETKYEWLQQQLNAQLSQGENIKDWMEEIKNDSYPPQEELEMKENELAVIEQTEQELSQKLAETDQKLKQIEEGGTYEEELQDFEENKESFQEHAHKYLVLKTAKKILRQAKSVYEKERQPEVVQKASFYFNYITRFNYTRLFAPVGEEKFIVEDKRGQWFAPVELSRGTAEQLYLSLRLALAESYNHSQVLPLIMDDPFVNFDRERQELAFDLLQNFSSHRQILYFTCDSLPEHVQDHGMIHQLV